MQVHIHTEQYSQYCHDAAGSSVAVHYFDIPFQFFNLSICHLMRSVSLKAWLIASNIQFQRLRVMEGGAGA